MKSRLKKIADLALRHLYAARYVATVILPLLVRTRKRPVIFDKYSGIGDIICTFPAVIELRNRHPGCVFIYNCHKDYACLPKLGGVADRVTASLSIGLVAYWYRFFLSGFYNMSSDDDRPGIVPMDVYIKDFGRHHGVVVDDAHPRLETSPCVVSRVQKILEAHGVDPKQMIVIHCGPSWPVREWPREHWVTLVQKLRDRGFTNIVHLGTSNHLALGMSDATEIPGTIPLVDHLPLEESVALISLSSLIIGIDSGLLHVAASVRTPSVGLWGATSSHLRFSSVNRRSFVTSPVECQGCHHRVPRLHWMTGCPNDIACMKAISVEDVLAACLARLNEV